MMDDITQAACIAIGMNVSIDRAIALVAAANYYGSKSTAPVTLGNVVCGIDFTDKAPRKAIGRAL